MSRKYRENTRSLKVIFLLFQFVKSIELHYLELLLFSGSRG